MVGQIKMIEKPQTASWDLSISDADFAKFRRSLLAKDMDDKWAFIPMTPQYLANQLIGYFGTTGGDSDSMRDGPGALANRVLMNEQPIDEELTDEESMDEKSTDGESKDPQATQWTDEESVDEDPAPVEEWDYESEPENDDDDEPSTLDLHESGYMSIVRAWSSSEHYRIAVKPRDGDTSAKIVSITWDPNEHPAISLRKEAPGPGTSEEVAKREVVILCRAEHHLGCHLEAAPEYD
ncbi:hypothetical protein N656DRAFT_831000 [Canariomyces notabilis]|uniref:Uncharacterized protein n=1 Tax=Canariomyces notabilis TaxID=2074819 RepID=A0AAN6T9Q9_9PEZI|nr:hypothetical protein N656DRAFT_831000 [Canariomyces arenarius]